MKLGFLTSCMSKERLEEIAKWAQEAGFQALEVDHSHIDIESLDGEKAKRIRELFENCSLEISSLGYHCNNLDPDEKKRTTHHNYLKKVIKAAGLLGVDVVSTFVGRDPYKDLEKNLDDFKEVFPELVNCAQEYRVKLVIENCPMETFPTGINLAYSPEIWEKMFEIIPSQNFGLNLDPSHLYWLGVDYIKAVRDFKDRIFHVHAKDTEILEDELAKVSIRGRGWWRAAIPGQGDINWSKFISTLYQVGYDGTISIEHEDPVWSGTLDKVKNGLILGKRHLAQFVILRQT